MNENEIKKYIMNLGVKDIGFSNIHNVVNDNWKHLNSAITVVIRLSDQIIDDIVDKPSETYFAHYRSVNYYINEVTLRIMMYLQDGGYKAVPIPASQSLDKKPYSGIFQHKTAATLSGLGWIGKSGLFIHHKYGPRVRLGTVLTDMKLSSGMPIKEGKCANCNKCVISCPAMAIEGNNWTQGMERSMLVNAHSCSQYMKNNFQHIGRGSVCGICISSCPVGK